MMPNFISPTIPQRVFGRKVVFIFKLKNREYYYDKLQPHLIYSRSITNPEDITIINIKADSTESYNEER